MKKTIIFLNLRFSDFYSLDLFRAVKEKYAVRLVAVLDQHFKNKIGEHILPYLDEIYFLQSKDKNGFLAEFDFDSLRAIVEKEKINTDELRIVCSDEFNLLNAGRLRYQYHLKGNSEFDMVLFRDKYKMKQLLRNSRLRVPHFRLLQKTDDFFSLSESIGLPFVIKPVDSCGSFGVHIIFTEKDYQKIENKLNHSLFEVEEYIEGKLYHVDSCTKNNEIIFICVNEYTCPNHDYTGGKALGSIPLDEGNELHQSLIHFAKKALKILGSNNMVNHMEIFVTHRQELIFLEVSARPPGGLLNFTHQINFGVNLMDMDFFMQTGLQVDLPPIKKTDNAFSVMFPLIPGKIKQFHTPDIKSSIDIAYFKEVGDIVFPHECNSIVGKMGNAILYHEDKAILQQDFEYMKTFQLATMETV